MNISAPTDYQYAARKSLPRFLYDYIDGGAFRESTLVRNSIDFKNIRLRQRVLKGSEEPDLKTTILGGTFSMPLALSPVGLTGMYARRGEVQAAKAAQKIGIPYTLSTVSVCPIAEVAKSVSRPIWFQLYVLKDREFMRDALARAQASGVTTLVFTVDMPVPGARYRDAHSGMSGQFAAQKRLLQAALHPKWAVSVGLFGRPHDLGNISAYRGRSTPLEDYIGWLGKNFDPEISWADLSWIRDCWPGKLIIKGILDAEDVDDAIELGADAIVVSNHGGRQLDGVSSTIQALPKIVKQVDGRAHILIDSGIRNGLDVIRALCLGADAAMIGRSYIYALASGGEAAVNNLLNIYAHEMRVAMTLMGVKSVADLAPHHLDDESI